MRITSKDLGLGQDRDGSTAEARIEVSFRPEEIEAILRHVGKEGRAKSGTAVVFPFRGELVVELSEEGGDTVAMQLHLSLEGK